MPKHKKMTSAFPGIRVKYKDVFDLKSFYENLRQWFNENDWYDGEEGKGEHWESYNSEKIDQGGGREIWIWWRLTKKAPGTEFIQYYIDLNFHTIALGKTEIVKDGKKMKLNKGEVEMTAEFYIDHKFEKAFDKHFILKQFKKVFMDRIYRKELSLRKKELYHEAYTLQNLMKQWFKLKRYSPYSETQNFFPSNAFPSHLK